MREKSSHEVPAHCGAEVTGLHPLRHCTKPGIGERRILVRWAIGGFSVQSQVKGSTKSGWVLFEYRGSEPPSIVCANRAPPRELGTLYIIYIYIFIYAIKAVTTHFTVLSAGKLCEAYIAGQRRPKECRALLLYQSSAHISGHLRWMMDDGWLISHHQKASEVDSFLRRHDVP